MRLLFETCASEEMRCNAPHETHHSNLHDVLDEPDFTTHGSPCAAMTEPTHPHRQSPRQCLNLRRARPSAKRQATSLLGLQVEGLESAEGLDKQ